MIIKKNVIAVSACHGTGKSAICYKIAHTLKINGYNTCVIDELARECPFPINQGAGWEAQMWLITTQIRKEIKLSKVYDYVISDRSILDSVAYGNVLNLIEKDDIYFIINVMKRLYKKIYILDPVAFDYHIADGVRDMDKDFRINIHNEIIRLHSMHYIDKKMIYSEQEILTDLENLIINKVSV